MVHSASWSKVLQLHAASVPATEYLSVLLAIRPKTARVSLAGIIQHERNGAKSVLVSLGIPQLIAEVLIGLHVVDPSFAALPSIIDQAIDVAVRTKRGTAVSIETAGLLSATAMKDVVHGLEAQFPQPIVSEATINPSLIGGGRLQIGSRRIDISTKTQLTRLRQVVRS